MQLLLAAAGIVDANKAIAAGFRETAHTHEELHPAESQRPSPQFEVWIPWPNHVAHALALSAKSSRRQSAGENVDMFDTDGGSGDGECGPQMGRVRGSGRGV